MKKLLIYLSIFIFLGLLPNHQVSASSEFDIEIDSSYNFNPGNPTQVNHTINIKNLSAKATLSEYSLQLNGTEISQVKARSQSEVIIPQIDYNHQNTTIYLKLNHPALGRDKVNTLNISYLNNSIATQIGGNFQVNLQPLGKNNQFQSNNVTLHFPNYLPQPSIVTPISQPQLSAEGISFIYSSPEEIKIIFGHLQSYQLDYQISLENTSDQPQQSTITLPPMTNKQLTSLISIDPQPENIITDSVGNWLALYTLKPDSVLQVNLSVLLNKSTSNFPYFTQFDSQSQIIGIKHPDSSLYTLEPSDQLDLNTLILGFKQEKETSIYLPQISLSDQYIGNLPSAEINQTSKLIKIKNPHLQPAIVELNHSSADLPAFVPPLSTQSVQQSSPSNYHPILFVAIFLIIVALLVYNYKRIKKK